MTRVTIGEAKQRLPELMDAALRGEKVVITHNDGRTVELLAMPSTQPRPQFGSAKGQVVLQDDFDDPIEGFEEYIG